MIPDLNTAMQMAVKIREQIFPDAETLLLAGSVVRGQATASSDLDLIVLYPHLEQAFRHSFLHDGQPVEAFVHDRETLHYFFWQIDRPSGVPSLANMVADGIEIGGRTASGAAMKQWAQDVLLAGPPQWNADDLENSRYFISDKIDDIRSPLNRPALQASLADLYPCLANHFCRSRNLWSANGKAIPARLATIDAEIAARFCQAFDSAFTDADTRDLLQLTKDMLAPQGGLLFDGYRRLASKDWRQTNINHPWAMVQAELEQDNAGSADKI